MQLAGQIALITGGSRGIGRATALAFAAEGADIAFCHLDDAAKAEETAAEITALGRRAMHRSVDVADIAATRAFAAEVAAALGPIDILFNNAGMNIRKPFEDYTEAEFDRIVARAPEGHVLHGAGGLSRDGRARPRLHHQRRLAARAEGRGELGALFRGQGGDHRLHPRAGVGGGAERRAGQRHRAGTDRYRPDRDDGAGRSPGVHRRAARAAGSAGRRKSPPPRCCWPGRMADSMSAPCCRRTAGT